MYVVCYRTEFLITASFDGHIKFWKKQDEGIEFVKHFKAHMGKNKGSNLFTSLYVTTR